MARPICSYCGNLILEDELECLWCYPFSLKTAGIKHDYGKPRPSLIIEDFCRAIDVIAEVGTFGALKYSEKGWESVVNGKSRYADAMYRHLLAYSKGEVIDPESKLPHLAHAAWNLLARLELTLRDSKDVDTAEASS